MSIAEYQQRPKIRQGKIVKLTGLQRQVAPWFPSPRHSSTSTLHERTDDYIAFEYKKKQKKNRAPCASSFFERFQGTVRRLPATWPTVTTKHTSLSPFSVVPLILTNIRCNSPFKTWSSTLFTGRDRDRALQP